MAAHFSKIFSLSSLILTFCIGVTSAYAAERLVFSENSAHLQPSLKGSTEAGFTAQVDLNEDGLDEYVLKTPSGDGLFAFEIRALTDEKAITLGQFEAHNLMLGNHYKHGIRNLLVFEDADNDFRYDVYIWNPQDSRYVPQNAQGEIARP